MKKEERYILGGKYQVLDILGEGGMSTVYKAKHLRLDTVRAIKEIRPNGFENRMISRKQLMKEAELLKDIHHAGIPEVMDIIEENGNVYIVMEYIQGDNLQELLRRRKCFSETEVIQTGKKLCELLNYLHDRSILYLDLKPSNVIRKSTGELVLIDFGTALRRTGDGVSLTMQMGTRGYAAPEQYILDSSVDERSDVFSLGMTLIHLLTGYSPERDCRQMHCLAECRQDISDGLKEVLSKASAQQAPDRYQNCYEMLYELESIDRQKKDEIRESKKKLLVFLIMIGAICCNGGVILTVRFYQRKVKTELVMDYMRRANHARAEEEAAEAYVCALKLLPEEEKIYEDILHYYMDLHPFSEQNSVILMSLLTTETSRGMAMKCLPGQEYAKICYDIGMGYFLQLGGRTGKKDSVRWFAEVEKTKDRQVDQDMKKRASLYRRAAVYYAKYTDDQADSKGKKEIDYRDLFKTISQINQCDLSEHSGRETAKGIYMITTEVILEISIYAQDLLEEGIPVKELYRELTKTQEHKRWKCMERYKSRRQMDTLEKLIKDTRERIGLISQLYNSTSYHG